MRLILMTLICCSSLRTEPLRGFQYKDNKSKYTVVEGNGLAIAQFDTFLPDQLTLCMRAKFLFHRHTAYLFFFALYLGQNNMPPTFKGGCLNFHIHPKDYFTTVIWSYFGEKRNVSFPQETIYPQRNALRKWVHICFAADFRNDTVYTSVNGDPVQEQNMPFTKAWPTYFSDEHRKNGSTTPSFNIRFGENPFDKNPSIGYIMDINGWDRVLTKEELVAISNCKSLQIRQGNILNNESIFNLTGELVVEATIDSTEVSCRRDVEEILLPARQSSFANANKTCNILMQGSLGPRFPDQETYLEVYARIENLPMKGFQDICWHGGRILIITPYKKASGDSVYIHMNDGSEIGVNKSMTLTKISSKIEDIDRILIWYAGPLTRDSGHFLDALLSKYQGKRRYVWSPCPICIIPNNIHNKLVLTLTGLCERSAFDNLFHVGNDDYGLIIFYGFESTIIRYDLDERIWKMTVENVPNATATCESDLSTFVLGNHDWKISNDYGCFSGGVEVKRLSFSSCTNDKYTCNDGLCVDLASRCNGQADCEDKSDELDCQMFEEDASYKKQLPPPPSTNKTKADIKISVDVLNIDQINEIQSTISFQYVLSLKWFDGRLNFLNLQDSKANELSRKEVQSLWMPQLILYNTKTRKKTLVDKDAIVDIQKMGNFKEQVNRRVFKGWENQITVNRFYFTSFVCHFDMAWYPFDTQTCKIEFAIESRLSDSLDLIVGNFTYSGPQDLTQYFIKKHKFYRTANTKGIELVTVSISLGRRLLSIILTIFIPTLILNLVGHSSNYFKEFFFEAVISLNVTVMLVLTTMFINVSNNLPKTAYIKMIDIWLIFNLLKPFNDIIVTTYMETLKEDESREVNHHGTSRTVGNNTVSPDDISPVTKMDLVNVKEKDQQDALRVFYGNLKMKEKNEKLIHRLKRFSLVINPMICLSFVVLYWFFGLSHYYKAL